MEEKYEVFFDADSVGKAEVVKQGLYYTVSCRCRIHSPEMCRLVLRWSDGWENLGIMMPERDGFRLDKKVAAKRIGAGPYLFCVFRLSQDPDEILFPRLERSGQENGHRETDGNEIAPGEQSSQEEPSVEEEVNSGEEYIYEDKPFCRLDELTDAKLEIRNGQAIAVFDGNTGSDVQNQTHGAVVGAEDIGIDGSGEDSIPESV